MTASELAAFIRLQIAQGMLPAPHEPLVRCADGLLGRICFVHLAPREPWNYVIVRLIESGAGRRLMMSRLQAGVVGPYATHGGIECALVEHHARGAS